MRAEWRIRTSPKRLELHFPVSYRTVPHAEENLLFVQRHCYSFCPKISTSFSLVEKTVTVCFRAAQTPQLLKLFEHIAPLTERIAFSQDEATLYIKYFADPSLQQRAVRVLFLHD